MTLDIGRRETQELFEEQLRKDREQRRRVRTKSIQEREFRDRGFEPTPKFKLFRPSEARTEGFDIEEGWTLKLTEEDGKYSILLSEGWEVTEDLFITPEGQPLTREQLDRAIDLEGFLGVEQPFKETIIPLEQAFRDVFPQDRDIQAVMTWAEQNQEQFAETLFDMGRTPETEALLRSLGVDTAEFFGEEALREPIQAPAVTEEGDIVKQGFFESFWDAIRLEGKRVLHQSAQYFVSTLPNLVFRDVKEGEQISEVSTETYTAEEAARVNRFAKKMRDFFRPIYSRNQVKFEEWVEEHPEFQPPPQASKDITENWELLKDPAYMGNVIGSAVPFMAGILATSLGTLYLTKNPMLAGLAATAFATPSQSQDLADELMQYGAPEDVAAQLAVPIGAAIASVEMVGNFPILKLASPFFKSLGGNIKKEVARRTVLELIKRFGKNFTMIQAGEVIEEILQGIIQDVTVKTYDKDRDLFDKIDETIVKTVIATTALATFGGAVSLRHVTPQEAATIPPEQKKSEGWTQDMFTGEWYKPEKMIDTFNENVKEAEEAGLSPEQARLNAYNEAARTPEGQKAIQKRIDEILKTTKPVTSEDFWATSDAELRTRWAGLAEIKDVSAKEWADLTTKQQDALIDTKFQLLPEEVPEVAPEAPELAPIPEQPDIVGREIAEATGMRFEGVQEGAGLLFTDTEVTGTTLAANTLEEARTNLAEKRRLFAEKPPVKEAKPKKPVAPTVVEVAPPEAVVTKPSEEVIPEADVEIRRQLGELQKMSDIWSRKLADREQTKSSLAKFVRENLPPAVRGKFVTSVAKVKTDAQLQKQMDKAQ